MDKAMQSGHVVRSQQQDWQNLSRCQMCNLEARDWWKQARIAHWSLSTSVLDLWQRRRATELLRAFLRWLPMYATGAFGHW